MDSPFLCKHTWTVVSVTGDNLSSQPLTVISLPLRTGTVTLSPPALNAPATWLGTRSPVTPLTPDTITWNVHSKLQKLNHHNWWTNKITAKQQFYVCLCILWQNKLFKQVPQIKYWLSLKYRSTSQCKIDMLHIISVKAVVLTHTHISS